MQRQIPPQVLNRISSRQAHSAIAVCPTPRTGAAGRPSVPFHAYPAHASPGRCGAAPPPASPFAPCPSSSVGSGCAGLDRVTQAAYGDGSRPGRSRRRDLVKTAVLKCAHAAGRGSGLGLPAGHQQMPCLLQDPQQPRPRTSHKSFLFLTFFFDCLFFSCAANNTSKSR